MTIIKGYDIDIPDARKALVDELQAEIHCGKKHFKPDFAQMCTDMELAWNGAAKNWPKGAYKVNFTQRFVRQKVAQLYAKNPRAVAKRRPRMDASVWDGTMQQLQMAMQGMPDPASAMAIIMDAQNVKAQQELYNKLGKTLEMCFHYYINEQIPTFKAQMKRCVRSAVQCAVGYVKLGFQRATDLSPDNKAKIADFEQRIAHLQRLTDDLGPQGDKTELDAEAEELRLMVQQLHKEPMIVIREGLVFDFPRATSIIPDPKCTSLDGWIGADWLAEELFMTPDEVKEFYKLDLEGCTDGGAGKYTAYSTAGRDYRQNPRVDMSGKREDMVCVWMMYHKPTGLKFELADGFKDFLKEPDGPEVMVEQYFPLYALCLNELEHPSKIFPPSDVCNIGPQQMEVNRARESLREHRKANRPGYVTPKGALSDNDKTALQGHEVSGVVELDGMMPGQSVTDYIQPLPKANIDPNLYETGSIMEDVYRTIGMQEAQFGGTAGATATEVATAETARTGSLEAEVDLLNDFLTRLARDASQIMLMELDPQTVQSIAGPGAVWPEMNREQVASELYLEIVAGSNGRPNKIQRQNALQTLAPLLMQIPGISPQWMAERLIEAVDDSLDLSDAFLQNVPSIQMMNNAKAQPAAPEGGGAPAPGAAPPQDPNAQGPMGGMNAAPPDMGAPPQGRGPGRPPLVPMPGGIAA